jgi:hypothetical protein
VCHNPLLIFLAQSITVVVWAIDRRSLDWNLLSLLHKLACGLFFPSLLNTSRNLNCKTEFYFDLSM